MTDKRDTADTQAAKRRENRAAPRIQTRFGVEYSAKTCEGTGTIRSISSSGALIEPAEPPLLAGGEVRLRFSFFENSLPIEFTAEVVRETETGFGVRFSGMSARHREFLKRAISKVRTGEDASESVIRRR